MTTISFPRISARSLDGRAFTLPEDFEGQLNIAVIAFATWQQDLVDRWFAQITPLVASIAGLRAYELPVIDRSYLPARPFIDGGMVASIPSSLVRARTLTVYTDLRGFQEAIQLPTLATVSALLVLRNGTVLWRGGGVPDSGQLATLQRAIASQQLV
jgi:hypothetical protein